jgi:myb proto-oncogene protein
MTYYHIYVSAVIDITTDRDDIQCREKWVNVLDPAVDRGPFRPEEDTIILEFVNERLSSGSNNAGSSAASDSSNKLWSELASRLPGRTDNQVWRRWKQHLAGIVFYIHNY